LNVPNFLIVGAQKSGTTSLKLYLDQHPDIFVYPQELHYFTYLHDKNSVHYLTENQYAALFPDIGKFKAIGEKSPSYLYSKEAPRRIKEYNTDMRLIALLRNPVERAYSNYMHTVQRATEPNRDFYEVIKLEEERINAGWDFLFHYVNKGLYSEQVARYFETFDKSNILIYLFEDLRSSPEKISQEIFRFLEVNDGFIPNTAAKHNTSKIAKNAWIGKGFKVFQSRNIMTDTVKKIVPYRVRNALKKLLYFKPEISAEAKSYLLDFYREDILKLQSLIDRDLSAWLNPVEDA